MNSMTWVYVENKSEYSNKNMHSAMQIWVAVLADIFSNVHYKITMHKGLENVISVLQSRPDVQEERMKWTEKERNIQKKK
jgi:hypothetical protein